MHNEHDFENDEPDSSVVGDLVGILLIGFGAFGALLIMQVGVLKAYFLASLLSTFGVFLPLLLCTIRTYRADLRPPRARAAL